MKRRSIGKIPAKGRHIRSAAVATAIAILVAAVGSRVNRLPDRLIPQHEVDRCLLEPATSVIINAQSLEDAVNSLKGAYKTGVELQTIQRGPNDPVFHKMERDARQDESDFIRLKNATLGRAVAAILRRFDRPDDRVDFRVSNDAVLIGPSADMQSAEPLLIRLYDVREWLSVGAIQLEYHEAFSGGHMEDRPEAVRRIVMEVVWPTIWAEYGGSFGASVSTWGNYLVVSAPAAVQRDLQRFIFLMRHPAGPGDGKGTR